MARRVLFISVIILSLLVISIAWFEFSMQIHRPIQTYSATINRDCAPWDGSAFTVSVPLQKSMIDISIYQSPDIKRPATFSFPDETTTAGNALLILPMDPPEQLTGKVSFQHVEQGIPVEGMFDLITESGDNINGKFIAEWGDEIIYCG
jgi:hypothetical protein